MIQGIWLPIITPFKNGKIDYISYKKLIEHYITLGIDGIIPMGTTGEVSTLYEHEKIELLEATVEFVNQRVPIFLGHGGNFTEKVITDLHKLDHSGIEGILSVSPYYNRPSQEGIYQHFSHIAHSTDRSVLIYNIPYRTGRNIENETLHRLAEIDNIIGIKDASGDFCQTSELLLHRPDNFSIMSGEDYTLFSSLALGGDGGILASAHLCTMEFVKLYRAFLSNDLFNAKKIWQSLAPMIPYLFREPNPAPIKHLLMQQCLISSDEVRLPLTPCSPQLKKQLELLLPSEIL